MWQIISRIKPPNILIGGLGLGLLTNLCLLRKDINDITIIEKSQDIIDTVSLYINKDYEEDRVEIKIVCGDFLDYLKYVIADIWRGGDLESWKAAILCRNEMMKNLPR